MKTHLGNYEIVSELGAGGMGRVYKAYEAALQRYVAIKELAPALAHNPILVERFLREARAMAALSDPHIVQIYSIGQDQDLPFFVMEFVDGESIAGILQRVQRLPVGDALKILYGSVLGLAVAHEQGVIHRDIKPANLILTQRGMVKLADFGIALAPQDFNNKLTGTDGADSLTGTSGDDRIEGLGGNDTIDGGTGGDRIEAGSGDDVVTSLHAGEAGRSDVRIDLGDGAEGVQNRVCDAHRHLDVARDDGRIKPGDLVMIEAMGGGFTWGAALLRW